MKELLLIRHIFELFLVCPHNLAVLGLDGMIERLEETIDDIPKDSPKWKQWEEFYQLTDECTPQC